MPLLRGSLFSVLIALVVPTAAHAEDLVHDVPTGPLDVPLGGSAFWKAGTLEGGESASFALAVSAGGRRLRVAYDTPSREDGFTVTLLDPSGASRATVTGSNVFNEEAFFAAPDGETVPAGLWEVRLTAAEQATHAAVRLRAKLERSVPAPGPGPDGRPRPLLPNFRSVPPYEFGFVAPANPANGVYPPDTVNPPLSVLGQEPLSCSVDESAPVELGGAGATLCLRLTAGPINIGEGPFLKTFRFVEDLGDGDAEPQTLRGPATQVIKWSDGSTTERAAGTYSWHVTHAHFHDDNILTYELFAVTPRGLEPAGGGTKSGFCPADQLMGEWRRFRQLPRGEYGEGDDPTGSCMSPTDGRLALTAGWGDVYRWQRPGQYVEFAGNGDGFYVVRTTVDKFDTTLESDETDNSAYALVYVYGRNVEIIERGQGSSHLDPGKVVFTGYGPASQDPWGALPPEPADRQIAGGDQQDPGAPAPTLGSSAGVAAGSLATPTPVVRVTPRSVRVTRVRRRGRVLVFRASGAGRVTIEVYARTGRRLARRTVKVARGVNRVRLARGWRHATVVVG